MESVQAVYEKAVIALDRAALTQYVEPIEHVLEVERLRQLYRPDSDIKFLLIAESHVRVTDAYFAWKGAGFIYEHRYYTPWWRQLILPAFDSVQPTNPAIRLRWLERLKLGGFWLLDVSILSLSGYRKIDHNWPNRPFDHIRRELLRDAWNARVGIEFERIMNQPLPPSVCAFDRISDVLPPEVKQRMTVIKFSSQSNSGKYFDQSYPYGTAKFREAFRAAGIDPCLEKEHAASTGLKGKVVPGASSY